MMTITKNAKVISGKITVNSGDKIVITDGINGQSKKKIITKKVGNDLVIFEEEATEPSAVLEDYYNTPAVQLEGIDSAGLNVPYVATETGNGFELLTQPLEAPAAGGAIAAASIAGGGATTGVSTAAIVGLGGLGVAGTAVAVGAASKSGGDAPTLISPVEPTPAPTPPVAPTTPTPTPIPPDTTAPTITSNTTAISINENSSASQVIYTATVTDTSAITYTLKVGSDTGLTINATSGAVTLTDNPDYETKSTYSFTVIATDSANNASEKDVTLAINNLDEIAPTITSTTTATAIAENSGATQIIYTITSTETGDVATGATAYTLKSGSDAGLTINTSSGEVTLTANPDFETKSSYSFTVVATDTAGNASEKAVTLAINDLDDIAPVFTSLATATTLENIATTVAVYTASATDASLPLAYTISGTDAGLFNLDATTGVVMFNASPNFEAPADNGANNIYDFTVRATDTAGNYTDQNVALTVTDVVELTYTLGQATIDLGVYGILMAPVQVDGKWFYVWDMNGDGTHNQNQDASGQYDYDGSVANVSGSGYQRDYTTHDVLDGLFNHNSNGVTNTVVKNYDGAYGTTNDYRFATLNGVSLALPTSGTELSNQTSYYLSGNQTSYYLGDNQTYTDLAEIWDSFNTGSQTRGTPAGWKDDDYWSATPSTHGHDSIYTGYGTVDNFNDDSYFVYVALQVL